jgi:hypothetical protein
MIPKIKSFLGRRLLAPMLVFLFVSAIYLYAFPQANVVYAVVVLLHALIGTLTSVYLLVLLFGLLRRGSWMARVGWLMVAGSAGVGIVLIKIGALRADYTWLYLHIVLALAGTGILFAEWAGRRGWLSPDFGRAILRYSLCAITLVALSFAGW